MKSDYEFAFEKLDVYHLALDFADRVEKQTQSFPIEARFALSSQFIRASDSIGLNIAEGYPGSDAVFIRYLNIAFNSANECVACSSKARRRGYLTFEDDEENRRRLQQLLKMISSLRKHVKTRGRK